MSDSEQGTARPSPMSEKVTKMGKGLVNYRPGYPGKKCGLCMYYGKRACVVTAGTIDPGGLCDQFRTPPEK